MSAAALTTSVMASRATIATARDGDGFDAGWWKTPRSAGAVVLGMVR
jgi:hypothetical protein